VPLPGDAVSPSVDDEAAGEERAARPRRGATRQRGAARQDAEPAVQAPPAREPRQPRRQPRNDGEGSTIPAQDVEGIVADSPFGTDGPIPAFLLRPTRIS